MSNQDMEGCYELYMGYAWHNAMAAYDNLPQAVRQLVTFIPTSGYLTLNRNSMRVGTDMLMRVDATVRPETLISCMASANCIRIEPRLDLVCPHHITNPSQTENPHVRPPWDAVARNSNGQFVYEDAPIGYVGYYTSETAEANDVFDMFHEITRVSTLTSGGMGLEIENNGSRSAVSFHPHRVGDYPYDDIRTEYLCEKMLAYDTTMAVLRTIWRSDLAAYDDTLRKTILNLAKACKLFSQNKSSASGNNVKRLRSILGAIYR